MDMIPTPGAVIRIEAIAQRRLAPQKRGPRYRLLGTMARILCGWRGKTPPPSAALEANISSVERRRIDHDQQELMEEETAEFDGLADVRLVRTF